MIHVRSEGVSVRQGVEFFSTNRGISGVFLNIGKWRMGVRWNRPKQLPPLWVCLARR